MAQALLPARGAKRRPLPPTSLSESRVVFSAFLAPKTTPTKISRMPDATACFCIARTVRKSYRGFHSPSTLMAVEKRTSAR
ncbi:MAG: short-chain fatty acyl-CoA regulator family protein [Thermoanaerobaculia bacterium]